MKNRAYIPALILLIIVFILHFVGIHLHIYTRISWYDDPVHFLMGVALGFAFYWALNAFPVFGPIHGRQIWTIVGLTLICAFTWECFEVVTNTAGYVIGSPAYIADTVKDIANGTLGSIAALIIIFETFEKKNRIKNTYA
jgi:hypothetical protein